MSFNRQNKRLFNILFTSPPTKNLEACVIYLPRRLDYKYVESCKPRCEMFSNGSGLNVNRYVSCYESSCYLHFVSIYWVKRTNHQQQLQHWILVACVSSCMTAFFLSIFRIDILFRFGIWVVLVHFRFTLLKSIEINKFNDIFPQCSSHVYETYTDKTRKFHELPIYFVFV